MLEQPRLTYRADIDGLRAVAIAAVVAFHAFPHFAPGGYVGVDVFFVISGFLITSLILDGLPFDGAGERSFRLRAFYANRIRRLFPALILVLIGCLALGWFVLLAHEYKQLGKEVFAGAAFVENFSLWRESGYFDSAAQLKPLLHLWSLGIEEQFYLFWPALLVLAFHRRVNPSLVILVVALISFAGNVLVVRQSTVAAFYSPFTRMWELMMGGGLAYIQTHYRDTFERWRRSIVTTIPGVKLPRRPANFKSLFGLLLILVAVFWLDTATPFPGWRALLPTVGTYLIISAGNDAWINRHVFSSRPFVFVGLISYPLYLWHWPLLSFAHILQGSTPSFLVRVAAVVSAAILACLTYWLVERRVRHRKHWAVTLPLLLTMTVIAGAGYNIFARGGLEFRLKGSELQRVKFQVTLQWQEQCRRDFKFAQNAFCLRGTENSPPTVALIGDSHAMTLFAGLGQYYASRGENLVLFGLGGGIPFYGMDRVEKNGRVTQYYSEFYRSALDYATRTNTIHTIILMNRSVSAKADHLQYALNPSISNAIDVYGEAMAHTLKLLLATHKEIIFIVDNPMMEFDPASCLPRPSGLIPVRTPCAIPRASYEAHTMNYRNKVDEVLAHFPTVKRWDPAKYLCDARLCWATRDKKVLYGADGEHLSLDGSHWLAKYFSPE